MKSSELKKKYIEFFKKNGHKEIVNASLIPEHDPSVLFTTAGMHPLVPFLLGQKHPSGKRLVNVQKCIRTGDIDEVGNLTHLSFFEMLGNWSLGDYWKKEAAEWSYEFLIKVLKIDSKKLHITCFAGDKDAEKDNETAKIWLSLGIPKERIYFFGKKDNWWGPAGETGPCGPDTEMFIDTGKKTCSKECRPGCSCGKYFEIWNNVFMQDNKDKRLILVDGMHCIYDKDFNPNKELFEILHKFNSHYLLAVNKFKEKGLELVKNYDKTKDTNWEAFSLEEKGMKKDNPEYFKALLKTFNLRPDEILYFDHSQKNVDSAMQIGIKSVLYKSTEQIKKFLDKNLYYFKPLEQKNVDTGMGVERTTAILQGKKSVYEIETIAPIFDKVKELARINNPDEKQIISLRIITDHLRASVFILGDENSITPSNLDQGYILRRFIRRAMRHGRLLKINKDFIQEIANIVIKINKKDYPLLRKKQDFILDELKKEEAKFKRTLEKGLNKFERMIQSIGNQTGKRAGSKVGDLVGGRTGLKDISSKDAFLLFQSYGFPIEMTKELADEKEIQVDERGFHNEYKKHQEVSRKGAEKKFKGGLSDASYETTKLHTAAHLLLYALRKVLGSDIMQKGSNITPERLRLDFNFNRKLTNIELKNIEDIINKKIRHAVKVEKKEMSVSEAKKIAKSPFEYKTARVSVYFIDDCIEICIGPHVQNTSELGRFKIAKQESSSAGVRRIKAILE